MSGNLSCFSRGALCIFKTVYTIFTELCKTHLPIREETFLKAVYFTSSKTCSTSNYRTLPHAGYFDVPFRDQLTLAKLSSLTLVFHDPELLNRLVSVTEARLKKNTWLMTACSPQWMTAILKSWTLSTSTTVRQQHAHGNDAFERIESHLTTKTGLRAEKGPWRSKLSSNASSIYRTIIPELTRRGTLKGFPIWCPDRLSHPNSMKILDCMNQV